MNILFYDLNDKVMLKVIADAVPRKGETVSIRGCMYEVMHVRWMTETDPDAALRHVEILVR